MILGGYWFFFYHHPLPPPQGNLVTQYIAEHGAKPDEWNQFTDASLKPDHIAAHWNKHTNAPRPPIASISSLVSARLGRQEILDQRRRVPDAQFHSLDGDDAVRRDGGTAAPRPCGRRGENSSILIGGGAGLFSRRRWRSTRRSGPSTFDKLNYSFARSSSGSGRLRGPCSCAAGRSGFWASFTGSSTCGATAGSAFPLAIIGMNSILVYCLDHSPGTGSRQMRIHLATFDQGIHGLIVKLKIGMPAVGRLSIRRRMGHTSLSDVFYGRDERLHAHLARIRDPVPDLADLPVALSPSASSFAFDGVLNCPRTSAFRSPVPATALGVRPIRRQRRLPRSLFPLKPIAADATVSRHFRSRLPAPSSRIKCRPLGRADVT